MSGSGIGVWAEALCTYPAKLDPITLVPTLLSVVENGIAFTPGRYGIDATPWTYELMPFPDGRPEVGPKNFVLLRRTAGPVPAGVSVAATYDVQFPHAVLAEDPADMALYGIWEAVEEAPDIFDGHQAQPMVNALLRKRLARPRELELTTQLQMRFLPGDTVQVDVPSRTLPAAPWLVTAVIDESRSRPADCVAAHAPRTHRGARLLDRLLARGLRLGSARPGDRAACSSPRSRRAAAVGTPSAAPTSSARARSNGCSRRSPPTGFPRRPCA